MAEQTPEAIRELILERHKAAVAGDYFAALGLDTEADADKVGAAYLKMAKSVPPDMVGRKGLDDVKTEATELFRFITEARDVLTDKKRRAQFERGDLEAQGVGKAGSAAKNARDVAKMAYQKGSVMLKKRGWADAEKHLREAVKANPEEPKYWQKLGWSIYQNLEDREDKERLEEASKCWGNALELNEEDAESHYYAALYHKAIGDQNRCRRALEQAVKLKPKHVEAQRELRLLKMRMEKQEKKGDGGGFLAGLLASFKKKTGK